MLVITLDFCFFNSMIPNQLILVIIFMLECCNDRASTNCDLFTLKRPDFDIFLKFCPDFSTKMFQFATARYNAELQKHVNASTAVIHDQSQPGTSTSARNVETEGIELGIVADHAQPTTTTETTKLIWKYTLFFTISHKSIFAQALATISLLLNATLSFTIPYQVRKLNHL